METIKTLTVGGETYRLSHPDDGTVGCESWSSRKIVDTLCPAFTKNGTVVTCEPVEGYPLTVTAEEKTSKITRCGKNLVDPVEYMKESGNTTLDGDVFTTNFSSGGAYVNRWDNAKTHPAGTYTVSAIPVSDTLHLGIFVYDAATGNAIKSLNGNLVTDGNHRITFTATAPFRVSITGASYYPGTYSYKLQMETGSVATAYEPYNGAKFTQGETIPALAGINALYADSGELTVSGRADPRAALVKLLKEA